MTQKPGLPTWEDFDEWFQTTFALIGIIVMIVIVLTSN